MQGQMQEGIATVEGDAGKLAGPCDGTRDRAQKSAARRKCPRRTVFSLQERMGAGQAGYIGANHLCDSQRLGNTPNKLFANGVAVSTTQAWRPVSFSPQTFHHDNPSSAFASKLWEKGKARKRACVTHSLSINSNPHLAVFPTDVCSVSQSSRKLKLIPSVSNKTFYDLFTDREDCFLQAFSASGFLGRGAPALGAGISNRDHYVRSAERTSCPPNPRPPPIPQILPRPRPG
jgi:hypothetical protein